MTDTVDRGWTPMDHESPLFNLARELGLPQPSEPNFTENPFIGASDAWLIGFGAVGDAPLRFKRVDLEREVRELEEKYLTGPRRNWFDSFLEPNNQHKNQVFLYNTWSEIVYGSKEESAAAETRLRLLKRKLLPDSEPPKLKDIKTPRKPLNRLRFQQENVPRFELQLQNRSRSVEELVYRGNQRNEMLPVADENNNARQNEARAALRRLIIENSLQEAGVNAVLEERNEYRAPRAAQMPRPQDVRRENRQGQAANVPVARRIVNIQGSRQVVEQPVVQIAPGHIAVQERRQVVQQPAAPVYRLQNVPQENRQGQVVVRASEAHGAPSQQDNRQERVQERRQIVEQPVVVQIPMNANAPVFVPNRQGQAAVNAPNERRAVVIPAQQENRQGGRVQERRQVVEQPAVPAHRPLDARQGQVAILAPRAPAQQDNRQGQVAQPAALPPPAPAPNHQIPWNANAPAFIPNRLQPHERLFRLLPNGPLFILTQQLFPAFWTFDNMEQILDQMRDTVHRYQQVWQPAPWIQKIYSRRRPMCCGFCYGTAKDYAESHGLRVPDKDSWGPWSLHLCKTGNRCTCPVLRSLHCEICNATGNNAHTTAYHRLKRAAQDPDYM